jgi:dienelactone hydrolase
MKKFIILLLLAAFLAACAPSQGEPTPNLEAENNPVVVPAGTPLKSASKINPNSVESLRLRSFGAGELSVEYAWENQPEFTRYYITYPSDGLTIHGFVNVPVGKGPFPVIIALHGFIPASEYKTRDYSTRYADALAQSGYIVLHPNMRNFPPSDSVPRTSDNLGGYTMDVLNLLALVRKQAGEEGIFKNADLGRLGIWGHSIGGGIALRILSIVPEIKAAVIYAGVSQRYTNAAAGYTVFDLGASQAAFSLHHGEADHTVQPAWTKTLNQQLLALGKKVEYFTYPGQPHTLFGQNDTLFIKRMTDFFKANL